MSEKKNIEDTKVLMENWQNHVVEQGGSLQGLNRSKVVQLLKRLAGPGQEIPVDDEDIVGSEDLPGGDGPDDAMPADGTDDDAVTVDDADVIDSGKDLSMGDVMTVLNQLRNTGGLSFEDMGNEMLDDVRDAMRKTIDILSKRPGIMSKDRQTDKENIEEVGNRILKRLEVAFEKLFQPRALVDLQEVLKTIKMVERQILNEGKSLKITIRG